jgi:hypothetical protein
MRRSVPPPDPRAKPLEAAVPIDREQLAHVYQTKLVAELAEIVALNLREVPGEHLVDLVLHGSLEFVPDLAPVQLGLDVADQFGAEFKFAESAKFRTERLGGADMSNRPTGVSRTRGRPSPGSLFAAQCTNDAFNEVDQGGPQAPDDCGHSSP